MPRIYTHENPIGKKFGRLTVIAFHHIEPRSRRYWLCRCDCGKDHVVRGTTLKEGGVRSCGCLNIESARANGKKYGVLNRGPKDDLTGVRFGRLIVESFCDSETNGTHWVCLCDCGKRNIVLGQSLKAGLTRSCGCLRDEIKSIETIARNTTHGLSHTPEYSNWKSMWNRCLNPKDNGFPMYGAIGIRPCKALKKSPKALFESIGSKPAPLYELDRIDNDLGYFCGVCEDCRSHNRECNIRWATRKEQLRNRSCNAMFAIEGVTHCASEWAEKLGMTRNQFIYRYRHCRVEHAA